MSENRPYDIFISYRRHGGAEYARPLKSELEQRGYNVFLDYDELKDGVFDKRIMDAIEQAPIFVFMLSAHSLDRCVNDDDWVRKEIEFAVSKNRHIVPVNPNKEFDGFPDNVPEQVKQSLGQHQFSHIDFEQLFKVSVREMIEHRIQPILSQITTERTQSNRGALIRIETDLDCNILRFGMQIGTALCGEVAEIRLPKGKHKISFVGVECDSDRYDQLLTVLDLEFEDYIEVKLRDKYNTRKAREEAERKAQEEVERKAREEAERKAREEAERKAREEAERKAREEAERKAREEAERKAREEAARKAREEAERRAREEAERKAREEAARKAREEAERKAREEAERRAREEAERKAREETERKAREEAERKARERAERVARMKKYSVGDYYNDGVREGVVFEVSADGCRGKIVSLRESAERLKWASDAAEYKRLIGANSETNGVANMAKVRAISGWRDKYPAFAWCADLGEGWYLPSKNELRILYNSGINPQSKLADRIHNDYWSSTEPNGQSGDYFNAWVCSWGYSHDSYSYRKYTEQFVRAVATFGEDILEDDIRVFVEMERKAREEVERKTREAERNAREEAERKAQNKKYNIGDYFNDGVREGVVFEVTADGRHGKIVSMKQAELQWSSDSAEQKRLIGADSKTAGAYNMAKVKAISGWRDKYPAFKWCADLGEGWYLPSIEELLTIYKNKDRLILNLTEKLSTYSGSCYWSSTEDSYQYSSGEFCAWYMNSGYTNRHRKNNNGYVRAVSAF